MMDKKLINIIIFGSNYILNIINSANFEMKNTNFAIFFVNILSFS